MSILAVEKQNLAKARKYKRQSIFMGWRFWFLLFVIAIFVAPLFTVALNSFGAATDVTQHLHEYVLPKVLPNTLLIVSMVTILATCIGVLAAWLVTMYEFPGRRLFSWSLLLPIALPGYVMAFVLLGLFDFTGPVQTALREWFGTSEWFPKVRSIGGAITALTLCLYPYVYLIVRGAFEQQGQRALEVAQSLGHSRLRAIFSTALPLARPWIFAGALLVMMETLADFGTVAVFNVDTFTTAIYKTWFGMDSLPAALRLAVWLMVFVLIVLWLEGRNQERRFNAVGKSGRQSRQTLPALGQCIATLFCSILLLVAFVLPVLQLLKWFMQKRELFFQTRYLEFFFNSLSLAVIGAFLLVVLSVLVIAAQRFLQRKFSHKEKSLSLIGRLLTVGYAIPGTVMAVGLFVPLAMSSNALAALGWKTQLLTGSLFALLLGYMIRFFAVSYRPIDSQLQRFSSNLEEMSESFQVTGWQKWKQVMLPLLRPGLLTAFALSFVDIMKEMPLTLMTRPFGWDTLAIQIFELTSEGEWEKAAVPALSIVLAGLIPVYLLNRQREK